MRENRTHGSEGGESGSTGLPYPYPDLAVRDGEWKLLCRLDGKDPRLFNIKSDPGETVDFASARVPLTKRLTESVLQWNKGLPEDATSDRFSTSTRW